MSNSNFASQEQNQERLPASEEDNANRGFPVGDLRRAAPTAGSADTAQAEKIRSDMKKMKELRESCQLNEEAKTMLLEKYEELLEVQIEQTSSMEAYINHLERMEASYEKNIALQNQYIQMLEISNRRLREDLRNPDLAEDQQLPEPAPQQPEPLRRSSRKRKASGRLMSPQE